MPTRNVYKDYVTDSYYHIYNRGVNKADIFKDDIDYGKFLGLIKRYLSSEPGERRANHSVYPNYHDRLELLAFCLMPNHFHLFVYQHDTEGMKQLMKSLSISYGMYFNKRYKRVGPVFQQRYKAVRITDDSQLLHITRYIHLNPTNYLDYKWSSLPYYTGSRRAKWLEPSRVLEMFSGDYLKFLEDYQDRRAELNALKDELADA